MKTKIKIESIFGKLLFEHEAEDNTIKKTLVEAVKSGAYLGGADLGGADLGGADLRGADLGGAYLGGADLGGADLGGAYLGGADLGGADLRGAYLGEEWGRLGGVSDVMMVGPIGSRDGYTTIFHTDKGLFVTCGCFRGALDEFAKKVEETHGDNKHARDYMVLIDFVLKRYEAVASGERLAGSPQPNSAVGADDMSRNNVAAYGTRVLGRTKEKPFSYRRG